jgi:hypothetical protein
VFARILEAIRPTQLEVERLATQETQLASEARFRPICAGPVAAVLIIGFIGLAAIPLGAWRLLRAGTRTDGG